MFIILIIDIIIVFEVLNDIILLVVVGFLINLIR